MRVGASSRARLYLLLLGYSIAVALTYALPIGLNEGEWYDFYSYLDRQGATPYIDVREGYPPLGFLIYMPLYYAFHDNITAFSYSFRVLNGALLVSTVFSLYLILRSIDEKRGLRLTLYYAALPSVVIANAYSNDVVALLPSALAIYMMVKRRAVPCGILLGLATLGKGFPVLLLIPALIKFKDAEDRLKLIGVTSATLIFASLPFMIINPFTYMSTLTHHASRGPWETVWALIDGYHSHGGLLHPFFDKFFYHFNLLKIYPASHYDHAIYEWGFSLMPHLLTITQITVVILLSLAYKGRKGAAVPLCGLLYLSSILFFKGYSTQFSVSTSFYMLLAAMNGPLIFLIPLEVSHIMQMISWWGPIVPELLRNEHLLILGSAVILRSIVFASLLSNELIDANISFKRMTAVIRGCLVHLNLLKDKMMISLISATILMAAMSYATMDSYLSDDARFRSSEGLLSVTQSVWRGINIDGLKRGDQIVVRLDTNTWLDVKLDLDGQTGEVERGVINPYNLRGSFNETMLFFVADSGSCTLKLRMKHPAIPLRVTDGLDGDLNIDVAGDGSALLLELHDKGVDGHGSMLRMAYPFRAHVGGDFSLSLRYRVVAGEVSNVLLDVFDDTDDWLYTFDAPEDFLLKPDTRDVHGHSNLFNDHISLVAVSVFLEDGSSATIRLEELRISSGEGRNIEFYAESSEEIPYKVFIERDFKPPLQYIATLILSVAFGTATIYHLYEKIKRYVDNDMNDSIEIARDLQEP